MDEQRLAALEARLRLLEDEREIQRLVAAYGPLVDDGRAEEVAALWTEDGVYDVDGLFMSGRAEIAAMVRSAPHQNLIAHGCAHFQGPVHVTVDPGADTATAASYSLLVLHRDGRFLVARATAHHWRLTRTAEGWRVHRRTSRALDGDADAHRLLADGVRALDLPVADGPFAG
ncbi:MAG TPA: nuclear transport factor 2 family protein [Nocardia sp.]|uniref:nuclear transport factor 2 family protein n=1 Tax=Nocardia sp. TaxID=1821 RepID=UPI002B4B931D|nr:nuclear transport factor 2 family protein [Nocardia sp.]HLS75444.1 nuclear transport factor 2 family protein [Nocardia sp.]